jgi:hypothetical protein
MPWTGRRSQFVKFKIHNPVPDGFELIFRAWTTLPDGSRLYARQVGKRAFSLLVRKDK